MEMNALTAVWIAEGEIEADQDKQIEAWQYLVDTGLAWSLQGSFGRMAQELIEQEVIIGWSRGRKAPSLLQRPIKT